MVIKSSEIERIKTKYAAIMPFMNEKARRMWLASEAMVLPFGGISLIASATGVSRNTIQEGIREIRESKEELAIEAVQNADRIRRPGGGRKPVTFHHPHLLEKLDSLLEPGDVCNHPVPLRWTCRSVRSLATEFGKDGFHIDPKTVGRLLVLSHFFHASTSKKAGKKYSAFQRNNQFRHINHEVLEFQRKNLPVVSLEASRKKFICNMGREEMELRSMHDQDKNWFKAYGNVTDNDKWENVGIDQNTINLVIESLIVWWEKTGIRHYNKAGKLLLIRDCSDDKKTSRIWNDGIQHFSNHTRMAIHICCLPRGIIRWSKISAQISSRTMHSLAEGEIINDDFTANIIGEPDMYSNIASHEWDHSWTHTKELNGEWNYSVPPENMIA